jgi:uncharacterized protein (DUF488 family)
VIIYKRQKLLLSLVEAAGGVLAATDLQKLLFLYTSKFEKEPSFKFVPYRYGCFSFQSYADRHTLIRKGMLLKKEDSSWEITPLAKPYLDKETSSLTQLFVNRTVPERGKPLVEKVYREEPFFASRSEIIDEIFPDSKEREKILSAVKVPCGKALFTLGYEGDSIDGYLQRLIKNGVKLLCDVRRNPLSRKTGFSKKQLDTYCSRVGIEYRHLPELGIPGHRRRELNSQADYDALFAEYEAEDLPKQKEAIQTLLELLESYQRIALTCFELEPHSCHRHCVSEVMESHAGCPIAQHI